MAKTAQSEGDGEMIMERERTHNQVRQVLGSRAVSAMVEGSSPLVELRQEPPRAYVAVRGRAVEMIGLPPLATAAPDGETRNDR